MLCRNREGGRLGLFKATNKLIGEAHFDQGAFWEPRMADPMACLLNTQSHRCVAKRGEGGQSALREVFGGGPPLAEGFDFVFIRTSRWAPGPCATLTQKVCQF